MKKEKSKQIMVLDDSLKKVFNKYDIITYFIVLVPIVIFFLRVLYKFFYYLGIINKIPIDYLKDLSVIAAIMLIVVICIVYILHKEESYKIIIGDIKCLVGFMLLSLCIGYFIPKTKCLDDIIASFTTLITSLFFISDGLSDMESISDTLKYGRNCFTNKEFFQKHVNIIKRLSRLKFILSFIAFTISISSIIYLCYVSLVNIENNVAMNKEMIVLYVSIILCTISTVIFPVNAVLLKIIFNYSSKNITENKNIFVDKSLIFNTF